MRDRHLLRLEIYVTSVNGVLPYPVPAEVLVLCVFRVLVMCWEVDLPSLSLRIGKGEAHCCVCHINLPSGMCHLFHSLNHRNLKRKYRLSCVFASIFNKFERSWLGVGGGPMRWHSG